MAARHGKGWSETPILSYSLAVRCTLCLFMGWLATGCAYPVTGGGRQRADALATSSGFHPLRLDCGDFVLRAWLRPGRKQGALRVYIEGDGFAWRTRTAPSDDPTPRVPKALALAAADPAADPVVYMGRPCQYVEGADRRLCVPTLWTSERYGERVVRALNAAVAQVMALTGAQTLSVFGYSGGGTLAALLVERRLDVRFWGTVAGNLDVDAWTAYHKVTPLTASLNPAERRRNAAAIPQVHVVGTADTVVPPRFARAWCSGETATPCDVMEVPGMTHGGAWERIWPDVLMRFDPASPAR